MVISSFENSAVHDQVASKKPADRDPHFFQWRSQSAEKLTDNKGRLLYQVVILYNYVPFRNGSKSFPLRAVPCGMENQFYHIR